MKIWTKTGDNITIWQDAWIWQQQYNVKNMVLTITMTILIAIINTVEYTKNAVVIVWQQC